VVEVLLMSSRLTTKNCPTALASGAPPGDAFQNSMGFVTLTVKYSPHSTESPIFGDGVDVGVSVGIGVFVGVSVGVEVLVTVGVVDGVEVAVAVGVKDGVGDTARVYVTTGTFCVSSAAIVEAADVRTAISST